MDTKRILEFIKKAERPTNVLLNIFIGGYNYKKLKRKALYPTLPDYKNTEPTVEKTKNNFYALLSRLKKQGFKSSDLIIVYDPVYAISTMGGKVVTPEEVLVGIISIKKILNQVFGKEFSSEIKIFYGGGVNSENAKDFITKSRADGLVVGGASLNAEEFLKILKSISES